MLLNAAANQTINRIVCDNNETLRDPSAADPAPCTSAFPPARVEGGAATGQADVDAAYDNAARSPTLYAAIGLDLTATIGRDIGGGVKALAQTVRLCFTGPAAAPTTTRSGTAARCTTAPASRSATTSSATR